MKLERLDFATVDWDELDSFADRVIFQTREWLEFLSRTQGGEPVVAAVVDGQTTVGYFTGMVVERYGLRILGSPLPGWTTGWMGFNLEPGASRREAVRALVDFSFGPLGCVHFELKDRRLAPADVGGLGFQTTPKRTFELDLTPSEDEILARMSKSCRWAIRKGVKEGIVVAEASGLAFAEEYYAQLEEVFARQSLRPTYGPSLVRELIRCLEPTGRLLLLRALAPDGRTIATAISLGMNRFAYMWGAASRRRDDRMRPNEAIYWYEMRYWKARGITVCDMGGGGVYKRKFGPQEFSAPSLRKSRFPGVILLREAARVAARLRQARRGATAS
jgi:hypothetical protein